MATQCPHCKQYFDVRLTKAPAPLQSNGNGSAADHDDLESLLDAIDDSSLSGWDHDFVVDTRARFEKYGEATKVSDKQMAHLRRIAGF